MKLVRVISALSSSAAASVAFAHPGHPTFGPVHSYGATELDVIALILVVAVALGAMALRHRPLRLRDLLTRFRKD